MVFLDDCIACMGGVPAHTEQIISMQGGEVIQ